ncbi:MULTISPECIES: hypothetical protein [unclassified Bifidobacterium]|uniref:hypothetical protein n=1 Tax=unclassified Bifidobacterium TaxID=2608897 RepID=UPI0023F7752F|nr:MULTISPECIES: hypothetical protein [unclassified Bifidobacterium]WEV65256.1 hypothetical protein OZX71_05635 [Bifidobacterium sp. ESL0764]WEV75941.1 hypothetical protein OZX75_01700 [Bifidobacterium sp. ESL0800]
MAYPDLPAENGNISFSAGKVVLSVARGWRQSKQVAGLWHKMETTIENCRMLGAEQFSVKLGSPVETSWNVIDTWQTIVHILEILFTFRHLFAVYPRSM